LRAYGFAATVAVRAIPVEDDAVKIVSTIGLGDG
jgi:hypothetical protein